MLFVALTWGFKKEVCAPAMAKEDSILGCTSEAAPLSSPQRTCDLCVVGMTNLVPSNSEELPP